MIHTWKGPLLRVADWLAVLGPDAGSARPPLPADWQPVVSRPDLVVCARPLPGAGLELPEGVGLALVHGNWVGDDLPIPGPDFDPETASLDELGGLRAGPLAACVVDPAAGRLHVRRDAGGATTLFETTRGGARLFCTRPAPLRAALPGAEIDPVVLVMFLEHLFVPAPHTPWKGIRHLFPGEHRSYDLRSGERVASSQMLRVNPRLSHPERYGPGLRGEAALEELDSALRAEMEATLEGRSDAALLLSSGKDSTSMLIAVPEARRRDVWCLTAAPRDRGKDESILAKRLAEDLGHPIQVEYFDDAMLERVVREELPRFDLPTGDAATAAMLAVVPKIGRPLSLMITGDAGDALFGFPIKPNERRLLALARLPLVPALCRWLGNARRVPYRARIRSAGRIPERFFLGWDGALLQSRSLSTDEAWRESLAIVDRTTLASEKCGAMQGVWFAAGHFPRARYPAEAAGVPVAFPWVGPRLARAVYRLAPEELTRGELRKAILVDWLERYAPDYIAKNPKARFSVDVEGLLGRFRSDLEGWHAAPGSLRVAEAGVPTAVLREVLRPWLATGDPGFARPVYALILLETWLSWHTR